MSHRILPLLFTTILCITPGLCQSNSDDAQSLPIPEIMDILNVIDTSLDDIVVRVRRLLDEASDGRETRIVSKQISEVCEVYLRTTSNLQQRVRILLTEIEEKGRTGGTDSDIADVNWILARTMEVVRNMESILVRTKAHLSSKETHGDLQWVLTNLEDLKSEADYLIGFARSRYSTDESRTPDSQRRKETETRQEEERKRKIEESKRKLEERNREMEERNREREERNREIEERKLEKEERKLEKEERNMEKEERNMEREERNMEREERNMEREIRNMEKEERNMEQDLRKSGTLRQNGDNERREGRRNGRREEPGRRRNGRDRQTSSRQRTTDSRGSRARHHDQYFDTSFLSDYLRDCPNCVVESSKAECPLSDQMLEMKKWALELHDLLRHGCQTGGECLGGSRCCVEAHSPFQTTVVQMTQMLKDVYKMFAQGCTSCSRRGGVPQWSAWSQCQGVGPDGRGTRRRERKGRCQAERERGERCTSEEVESESCLPSRRDMSECCEPGQWASWQEMTSCPQTCGSFVQQRSRSCRAVRADRRCAEAAMPLEQRIEQMCPSPKPCGTPVCITSCSDVKDGVYPSCSSCTDYIRCDAGRARVMRCSPAGFEFNSETKRCSEPPSATCTYKAVECDEDGSHQRGGQCDAMWRCRDGQLLDLWRCPSGLSFDLRTLTCVSQSSTCVDSVIRTHILEDLIPDVQSIIGGSIQPF